MKKIGDFAGTKNGNLQAIQFIKRDKGGHQIWLFKCDCGCLKEIKKWNVLRKHGPTNSCGKCSFSRRGKRGEGFKNKDCWNDLLGIAPDATGELLSEEFVRSLRNEW